MKKEKSEISPKGETDIFIRVCIVVIIIGVLLLIFLCTSFVIVNAYGVKRYIKEHYRGILEAIMAGILLTTVGTAIILGLLRKDDNDESGKCR